MEDIAKLDPESPIYKTLARQPAGRSRPDLAFR
jgi:hypothetical protein